MKTILVATDYTKASWQATNYAATLTRRNQAKIILFNSFELPENRDYQGGVCPPVTKLLDEHKVF